MLDVELLDPSDPEKAAALFHRDGFVAVRDALTPEQLAFAQAGADRVIAEQMSEIPLEKANRGYARYSFGPQLHHPEWVQLIDLPTILPILEAIWANPDFICTGGGGDYSTPGAKIQHLHADIRDTLRDPLEQITIRDLPPPFIVVNFTLVEFKEINGAIRFIRSTQRSRHPIPTLEEEPEWMKRSVLCAPPGTAIVRDVRCWHGGTANRSDEIRPMTSAGYVAPWFRLSSPPGQLPRSVYNTLSPRAKELTRTIVEL